MVTSVIQDTYSGESTDGLDAFQPVQVDVVEQWLQLSANAPDPQAAMEYAQRALGAQPNNPRVHQSVQRCVLDRLNQDAFVAFLAETSEHYLVRLRTVQPVMMPKVRAQAEVFPDGDRTRGERALSKVWWLVLGLIPAGVGTLILSPWVAVKAWQALSQNGADAREQRLGWLSLGLTLVLAGLGAFFSLLLLLHLIG